METNKKREDGSKLEKMRSPLFLAAAFLGFAWLGSKKKSTVAVKELRPAKNTVARSTEHNGQATERGLS